MEWKVWYHTEVKQLGGGYKRGTLRIDGDSATLETKEGTIEIAPIRSVGQQRVSLWLFWAAVEYGPEADVKQLYMGDRRFLGWAGILGSNNKITESLQALQGAAAPAPAG